MAYYFYLFCVMTALAAAAVLVATDVQAQAVVDTASPQTIKAASPAPRYSAQDIERAFGFIDSNQNSSISREEASGFRNVAKHFDAADTNKDGVLSLEEFSSALNRP